MRACCHRVYRVDRAPRGGGPPFIIFAECRLRRCLGTTSGALKSGCLPDANKRSERTRKLVRVRACTRVRVFTPRSTAFYGFLTDHISRRRTTSRAPFVLSNKVANLHAYTQRTMRALLRIDSDDLTGVPQINRVPRSTRWK